MTLTLIIVVAVAVVCLAERSVEHLRLAIAALCLIAAVLLFVVADLERAILLSSILAAAIFGASNVKYRHSGLKLTLSLIHISEPTRRTPISYAVFCSK